MKCLSVKSPHAENIIVGLKTCEYRSWAPVDTSLPMRIAIHRSGQSGAVIGTVEVYAVVEDAPDGGLAWLLREPMPLPCPVPCSGALWLWDCPPLPA